MEKAWKDSKDRFETIDVRRATGNFGEKNPAVSVDSLKPGVTHH